MLPEINMQYFSGFSACPIIEQKSLIIDLHHCQKCYVMWNSVENVVPKLYQDLAFCYINFFYLFSTDHAFFCILILFSSYIYFLKTVVSETWKKMKKKINWIGDYSSPCFPWVWPLPFCPVYISTYAIYTSFLGNLLQKLLYYIHPWDYIPTATLSYLIAHLDP